LAVSLLATVLTSGRQEETTKQTIKISLLTDSFRTPFIELQYNIFSVKTVSFDQGERDPFGFDDFSEKLGAEYLPFSGTVSKPSYFLFVAYINHILNNKLIPWKNEKQKKEIQIRLEKLMVYCWKKKANEEKEVLRGSSILGNSFDLTDIDVFSSKGWVKQNAFKIYTDKNFALQTLELYLKKIGDRQIPILNDFILSDHKQPQLKADFLKELLKRIRKRDSLFNNHRLEFDLQKKFKKELLEKIKNKRKSEYLQYVEPFFAYKTFNENNFWIKLLDNKNLPFVLLNDWFGKFVSAVDADINNKPNWIEADKSFDKIPKQFHSVSKSEIVLQKRMKKSKWFQYNEKENRYTFFDRGNKAENRRIENLWESYKKRQGEEVGIRYFFNYRHYALLRLLKELQ
jgi:hypothetical protein